VRSESVVKNHWRAIAFVLVGSCMFIVEPLCADNLGNKRLFFSAEQRLIQGNRLNWQLYDKPAREPSSTVRKASETGRSTLLHHSVDHSPERPVGLAQSLRFQGVVGMGEHLQPIFNGLPMAIVAPGWSVEIWHGKQREVVLVNDTGIRQTLKVGELLKLSASAEEDQ